MHEDLNRILFIRNYIEECSQFIKETRKDINAGEYIAELKNYALKLFLIQCKEAIPNEEKKSKDFNLEVHQKESAEYFNYIYDNLKYFE